MQKLSDAQKSTIQITFRPDFGDNMPDLATFLANKNTLFVKILAKIYFLAIPFRTFQGNLRGGNEISLFLPDVLLKVNPDWDTWG